MVVVALRLHNVDRRTRTSVERWRNNVSHRTAARQRLRDGCAATSRLSRNRTSDSANRPTKRSARRRARQRNVRRSSVTNCRRRNRIDDRRRIDRHDRIAVHCRRASERGVGRNDGVRPGCLQAEVQHHASAWDGGADGCHAVEELIIDAGLRTAQADRNACAARTERAAVRHVEDGELTTKFIRAEVGGAALRTDCAGLVSRRNRSRRGIDGWAARQQR